MKSMRFVLKLLLGGLLLYSGLAKFQSPYEFLTDVNAYALTKPATSVLVAAVLPWLEMVTGVSLIGGLLAQGATIVAVLLFALFTVATSSAWLHGLHIDCGCFGDASEAISGYLVARSAGLLVLALLTCALELSGHGYLPPLGALGRGLRFPPLSTFSLPRFRTSASLRRPVRSGALAPPASL